MDSLRSVLERKGIAIVFGGLLLVFLLGATIGCKISTKGVKEVSTPLPASAPDLRPTLVEKPTLEEETKKVKELQVSAQVPETLEKDEAETAETAIPVPAGEEIFSLAEGTYRETSSAKGMIGTSGGYSKYIRGRRWVEFSYSNISKQVLDTKWTVVWKDAKGTVLRTDEGRHSRLLPGDYKPCKLQYPDKAVSYEFWVEAERSRGIPGLIDVNYIKDPSLEGDISIDYELKIKEKGTPKERWAIKVTIENVSKDRSFKDVALYFRKIDGAGNVILADNTLEYSDPEFSTEDDFHRYRDSRGTEFIKILPSGHSKDFSFLLPYETTSFDFYLEADEFPSSLTFEYIPTSGEVELENSTIFEGHTIERPNYFTILGIGRNQSRWLTWVVKLEFFAPSFEFENYAARCCKYIFQCTVTDPSGEILAEGSQASLDRGEGLVWCDDPEKGRWEEIFILPREAAKFEIIERLRKEKEN